MTSPVIVALDLEHTLAIVLAKKLDPENCRLKVGSQLFTSAGPKVIEELSMLGFDVFLDLKFHDIPNTVAQSVKAAANLGVWMLNVHASGGSIMMNAAQEATSELLKPPLIIGVTMLTSLSEKDVNEIGIQDISNQALSLASLAKKNYLDGVVCSVNEVRRIKELLGKDFITVTPGIRFSDSQKDDQSRVSTARNAIENGTDYLVIGRPITQSDNPMKSLDSIIKEIS
ncbi:orotidine-5'-phosphate decarboxylase [Gammaproteobacteria bacterium]|nr:orotidine-5'-phosphate decarboxylase [Gammaproteobacteria bacterium]